MTATAAKRSFRDPGGCVLRVNGRILRSVVDTEAQFLRSFVDSNIARDLVDTGRLVRSTELASREGFWFEHETIPFPSYPFEWSPAMLAAAASLTLDISRAIHPAGLWLKDATPSNVLFRGSAPVFVDLLSFEPRQPGQSVWRPFAQFVSTFLLPLALARRGHPLGDLLLLNREGISPDRAWRCSGWLDRFSPPLLGLVTIPYLLGKLSAAKRTPTAPQPVSDPDRASFVVDAMYRWLEAQVRRVSPPRAAVSRWTGYMSNLSYDPSEFDAKHRFVGAVLDRENPESVLDIGANTGHFSLQAAASGAEVVAIDSDPSVIDALWRQAAATNLNILPLVVDFARPTPAMGWRYTESDSFLDRSQDRFSLTLMLAVLHHLLVTDRIPLDEILSVAAGVTRRSLVIEYVDPADPMFREIARGRDALHAALTPEIFARACEKWFTIVEMAEISRTRRIFHLRKR